MTNASDFPRGALTNYLLSVLGGTVLVGDGKAPSDGGWTDDPNADNSSYVPYTVLLPLTAQNSSGSFGDSGSEWQLPFSLTSYGIARSQVEQYASMTRNAVLDLQRSVLTLDSESWKVVQVRPNSIGGVARTDTTEPPEFSEIDAVTMWMTKEM